MEFLKKSIHMDQIGCEEQTQITLEDDVNIADAKPDVYQVVTQQGHVELEEVRASDGHVHVKGVENTVVRLNSLGIVTEPIRTDEFTGKPMTFFADPDGLPLEIHE